MSSALTSLIDKITIVPTPEAVLALLREAQDLAVSRPVRMAFVNAHAANMCHDNPDFLRDLLACDYVLRDGAGMKILYKMLDRPAGLNLNGTDLIPQIIEFYKGRAIALMGTSSPYLEAAASVIAGQGGQIAGTVDGFQEDGAYPALVSRIHPDLIVLAMGMPRQEKIAAFLAQNPGHPSLIVCGGAILDFMGGKVTRAPQFFRKVGMEWLYRLLIEPKRLFGRYVVGNGVFLLRAACFALRSKQKN